MMPQRASRRRILSIKACMVNLLSVRGRVVNGGEAGATPALPLGRRRTDADLTERPSGALEGRGGAAPASPPARGRGPLRRYAGGASRAPPTGARSKLARLRGGRLQRLVGRRPMPSSSKRVSLLVNAPVAV